MAVLEALFSGLSLNCGYELKVQDAPPEAYGEYKACKELRADIPRQRVILTR